MSIETKKKSADDKGTNVRHWPRKWEEAVRTAASHVARYNFAKDFVADKTVCDIGCGVGYGSNYLAQTARQVTAMDLCPDAIAWAREHFSRDNLRLLTANVVEQWDISDEFNVITSFETMEHVDSPEIFLNRIYEHLSPGGTLILSVPNGPRDRNKTNNPYHLHHFSDSDLKKLIENRFSRAQYFSQAYRKNIKHYAAKMMRKVKLLKKQPYFVNNYYLAPELRHDLKTWIVIAHK